MSEPTGELPEPYRTMVWEISRYHPTLTEHHAARAKLDAYIAVVQETATARQQETNERLLQANERQLQTADALGRATWWLLWATAASAVAAVATAVATIVNAASG